MSRRHLFAGLAVAATAPLALAGCATGSSDAGSSGEPAAGDEYGLVEAGPLTVCSAIPYPPFALQGDDGEYTGFDIDLLGAIAEQLDLELSVQDVGFDALQSGTTLAAGTCDVGASAMTITDERKANIDDG